MAPALPGDFRESLNTLKAHNPLGLIQGCLYLVAVLCGLIVTIAVGITIRNFDGQCVLFAEVVWDNEVIYPWTKAACDFTLYGNLAINIFYATIMAIFTFLAVLPRTTKDPDRFGYYQWYQSRFALKALNPMFTLVNSVVAFIMLVLAVVLTSGLASFCVSLQKALQERGESVDSCMQAAHLDWRTFTIVGGRDTGVRGARFHINLTIASLTTWALTIIWCIQLVLNFSLLCTRCSCKVAEEKQRPDKARLIAQRRSRLGTPIGTPGHMTPRSFAPPPMGAHGGSHMIMHPQVSMQPPPPKA